MTSTSHTPFWQRPVVPSRPVDLSTLKVYRRSAFQPDAGPGPWLDQPDAEQRIAQRLAAGEITAHEAELCRKWVRDGYLILEGFYAPELIDKTWREYEEAIAAGHAKPPAEPIYEGDPLPGRRLNVHFYVPAMDEMLHEPRMSHIMSVLLGARTKPFQTIIGHKSSQQLAHSDSIHMTTYPNGYLAANWVAYEDIDPKSGPLVYYPGSHKLPYVLSDDCGISPEAGAAAYGSHYEPAIQRMIAEHNLKPEYFIAKKGDVLIWHANLLHGGTRVEDAKLSRKALVCHFFAEGVVCYHDLVGTLSHTQLGYDLYQRRRPVPATPVGLISRAVGAVRRRLRM
jgi:Protein involved in biosynthesis of mitomycin antibiotics/polyketide fumonisin